MTAGGRPGYAVRGERMEQTVDSTGRLPEAFGTGSPGRNRRAPGCATRKPDNAPERRSFLANGPGLSGNRRERAGCLCRSGSKQGVLGRNRIINS